MPSGSPDFHSGVNQGVAPVTYGQGERPPRGDYAQARADYTCEQDWAAYTPEQHALYRRLFERQAAQLPGLACDEFIAALRGAERDAVSRDPLAGRGRAGADP
jgi:phenylalanine-4-hydroxylase